ncbi:uncharacterized protein MONBRDRAFT_23706 [Monosiga brevicollis MX1]|uniref:TNFR-Cys domain-containing protein n=1 Tax=Monosiga brevicollis TaxID=81824 RepID=A9UU81_MONBE|nr:uncharacterized protein MONBRDRAFT_23706 [Monosiga brevicollis MX1]EDQ91376.1 predicted protein [Monosiga brevicollis MX1]|eukprot:XP_001743798.1 hypothetical protein [Monosiga brevicollis MX1]
MHPLLLLLLLLPQPPPPPHLRDLPHLKVSHLGCPQSSERYFDSTRRPLSRQCAVIFDLPLPSRSSSQNLPSDLEPSVEPHHPKARAPWRQTNPMLDPVADVAQDDHARHPLRRKRDLTNMADVEAAAAATATATASPTPTLVPCPDGYFLHPSGVCHPCTSCQDHQYRLAPCNLSTDTICQNLTDCSLSQYQASQGTDTSDRICLPLRQQCIPLTFGHNFFSFHVLDRSGSQRVDPFLPNLTAATFGDTLEANLAVAIYLGSWLQTSALPDVYGTFFRLYTSHPNPEAWCLRGRPMNLSQTIPVVNGFNRLGYPNNIAVELTLGLAALPQINGMTIYRLPVGTGNPAIQLGGTWFTTDLTTIQPGAAYILTIPEDGLVDGNQFQNSMQLMANASINGQPLRNPSARLASFTDGRLSGTVSSMLNFGDQYFFLMAVGGNNAGEVVTLKIYDPDLDLVLDANESFDFQPNGRQGDVVSNSLFELTAQATASCNYSLQYLDEQGECQQITTCTEDEYVLNEATSTSDRTCVNLTECEGDEVEFVAATATSDRTCRLSCTLGVTYAWNASHCEICSTCDSGEFEAAVCTNTSDTVCQPCATCDSGEFEAAVCTNTSDTVCQPCATCDSGEFEAAVCTNTSDTVCQPCATCDSGEFEAAVCTNTSDTVCQPCATCDSGEFEAAVCTNTSDTVCQPCATCDSGEFEAAVCTNTSDTVCQPCATCDSGEFEAAVCTNTSDTVCQPCATCDSGEFEAHGCSALNDTVCQACSICAAHEFEVGPCSGDTDHQCQNLTICVGDQIESSAPTATSDRLCELACEDGLTFDDGDPVACEVCSTCGNGSFTVSNCTVVSDTSCTACSTCSTHQYLEKACTPWSDSVCHNLTICNSTREYESEGPSATSDRTCADLDVCDFQIEFVAANATATSNRVCQLLTECQGDQYEVEAPTMYSDRVCGGIPTFNSSVYIYGQLASGSGLGGVVIEGPTQVARGEYDFSVVAGASGTFVASAVVAQGVSSFTSARRAATSLRGYASPSDVVYGDNGRITVYVQAFDDVGSTQVLPGTLVSVRLNPHGTLVTDASQPVTGSCTVDAMDGICSVTLSLRETWLMGTASDEDHITVEAGLASPDEVQLGNISVIRQLATAISDNIWIDLPQTSMYAGASAVARIYSNTTYAIGGFTIQVTCEGSDILIEDASADSNIWSGARALLPNGTSVRLVYTLKSGQSAPVDASGAALLAEIQFAAASTLNGVEVFSLIRLETRGLLDTADATRVPAGEMTFPVPGIVVSRDGDVTSLLSISQIQATSSAILSVEAGPTDLSGDVRVRGIEVGSSELRVVRGSTELGRTGTISVLSTSVRAVAMDVRAISQVRANFMGTVGSMPSVERVRVQVVEAALKAEGSSVRMVASAVYADGTREPLTAALGLMFNSSDSQQITMSTDEASVAVGAASGVGPYVHAAWSSVLANGSVCENARVASGFGNLTIDLPPPSSVSISGVVSRYVRTDDVARFAGVSTGSELIQSSLRKCISKRYDSGGRVQRFEHLLYPRTGYTVQHGEFEAAVCTNTSDTVCQPCATCDSGEFEAAVCTNTSDTVCQPCATCDSGEFEAAVCTNTSDTVCQPCATCDSGEFVAGVCTNTSDTVCQPCATCDSGEFEAAVCTNTSDTVCQPCATCDSGEFEAAVCTNTSDTVCQPCATCDSGEFEAAVCTNTSDTVCQPCATCDSGEFEAHGCSALNDTVCQACSICAAHEFEVGPCSGDTDRQCQNLTVCGNDEIVVQPATTTSDRVCASIEHSIVPIEWSAAVSPPEFAAFEWCEGNQSCSVLTNAAEVLVTADVGSLSSSSTLYFDVRSPVAGLHLQAATPQVFRPANPADSARLDLFVWTTDRLGSLTPAREDIIVDLAHPLSNSVLSRVLKPGDQAISAFTFDIPYDWFSSQSATVSITASYAAQDLSADSTIQLVRPAAAMNDAENAILMYLPTAPQIGGDSFSVEVWTDVTENVSSFTLSIEWDATALALESVKFDAGEWQGRYSSAGKELAANGIHVGSGDSSYSRLLSATFRGLPDGGRAMLSAQGSLHDENNNPIEVDGSFQDALLTIVSRDGRDTSGYVYLTNLEPILLLGTSSLPFWVDTSRLETDSNTGIEIHLVQLFNDGTVASTDVQSCRFAGSLRTCSPAQASEDGTHSLEIFAGELSANIDVIIYRPSNIAVLVDDLELNRLDLSNCSTRYQRSQLRLQGVINGREVDLSAYLKPSHVSVDDSDVAAIGVAPSGSLYVQGVSPGSTVVRVAMPGFESDLTVLVTPAAVEPVQLSVEVITTIAIEQDTLEAVVRLSSEFVREKQQGWLIAQVSYSDATSRMPRDQDLQLDMLQAETAVDINGTALTAISQANNAVLQVTLLPDSCVVAQPITAITPLDLHLPDPTGIVVSVSSAAIAAANSVAACAGITTQATLSVVVQYPGYSLDLSRDDRMRVSLPETLNLTDTRLVVTQAVPGLYLVNVSFLHINLTGSVAISVAVVDELRTVLRPWPAYAGSGSVIMNSLHPIEGTDVIQRAQLEAVVTLLPNSLGSIDVSHMLSVTTPDTQLSIVDTNRIVPLSVQSGLRSVTVQFCSLETVVDVVLSQVPRRIAGIFPTAFPSTLSGIAGSSVQLQIDVELDDGTRWNAADSYTSEGDYLLAGAVIWESTDSSVVVDGENGMLLLMGNSFTATEIFVTSPFTSANARVATFVNLVPEPGDIDLGASSGAALGEDWGLGGSLTIPVRVNAGLTGLAGLDLTIEYDPAVLAIQAVEPGSDWVGNSFIFTANDPPGQLRFGGTTTTNDGIVEVAVITFSIMGTETDPALHGYATSVSDAERRGIGSPTPRAFVAGDLRVVGPDRFRRGRIDATRWRRDQCATHKVVGDADADCVVGVNDVLYLQDYLVQAQVGPTAAPPLEPGQLDVDLSGDVTILDAVHLLRVVFGQLRLLSQPTVTSVRTGPYCRVVITVNMTMATQAPAVNRTFVYFDVEHPNLAGSWEAVQADPGLDSIKTGAGLGGAVVRARGLASGLYEAHLEGLPTVQGVGLSVIQITTDQNGGVVASRRFLHVGSRVGSFAYPAFTFDVSAPAAAAPLPTAIFGYSPLLRFDVGRGGACGNFASTTTTAEPTTLPSQADDYDFLASTTWIVVLIVLILLVCCCLCLCFCCWRRRMPQDKEGDDVTSESQLSGRRAKYDVARAHAKGYDFNNAMHEPVTLVSSRRIGSYYHEDAEEPVQPEMINLNLMSFKEHDVDVSDTGHDVQLGEGPVAETILSGAGRSKNPFLPENNDPDEDLYSDDEDLYSSRASDNSLVAARSNAQKSKQGATDQFQAVLHNPTYDPFNVREVPSLDDDMATSMGGATAMTSLSGRSSLRPSTSAATPPSAGRRGASKALPALRETNIDSSMPDNGARAAPHEDDFVILDEHDRPMTAAATELSSIELGASRAGGFDDASGIQAFSWLPGATSKAGRAFEQSMDGGSTEVTSMTPELPHHMDDFDEVMSPMSKSMTAATRTAAPREVLRKYGEPHLLELVVEKGPGEPLGLVLEERTDEPGVFIGSVALDSPCRDLVQEGDELLAIGATNVRQSGLDRAREELSAATQFQPIPMVVGRRAELQDTSLRDLASAGTGKFSLARPLRKAGLAQAENGSQRFKNTFSVNDFTPTHPGVDPDGDDSEI